MARDRPGCANSQRLGDCLDPAADFDQTNLCRPCRFRYRDFVDRIDRLIPTLLHVLRSATKRAVALSIAASAPNGVSARSASPTRSFNRARAPAMPSSATSVALPAAASLPVALPTAAASPSTSS